MSLLVPLKFGKTNPSFLGDAGLTKVVFAVVHGLSSLLTFVILTYCLFVSRGGQKQFRGLVFSISRFRIFAVINGNFGH